jgi:V/A-type H+-transporting ATPase subunit C
VIKDVLSYLYVNAKVMAKEGKFIAPMRWDDLWGCTSPAEVASLLEGTDYFPYLAEGATQEAKELEKAILEEFSALTREISAIIPKSARPIREYLLRRWDVMNLRTIMRGIHGEVSKGEIVESMVEGGELDYTFLKDLIDVEGMDGFVALLARTPYHGLTEGLDKYHATHNLFFLEALLDKVFWQGFLVKILNLKGSREFRGFIEVCAQTHNLKMILRAKNNGLSLEEVSSFLISESTLTNELTNAYDEEELSGLISLLEGTVYFEPLVSAQADYERTGSVFSFEAALDNLVEHHAEDIRKVKPFGPGPLIGFIVSKEAEVRGLTAIVRSTEVDLDRQNIRETVTRKQWTLP